MLAQIHEVSSEDKGGPCTVGKSSLSAYTPLLVTLHCKGKNGIRLYPPCVCTSHPETRSSLAISACRNEKMRIRGAKVAKFEEKWRLFHLKQMFRQWRTISGLLAQRQRRLETADSHYRQSLLLKCLWLWRKINSKLTAQRKKVALCLANIEVVDSSFSSSFLHPSSIATIELTPYVHPILSKGGSQSSS